MGHGAEWQLSDGKTLNSSSIYQNADDMTHQLEAVMASGVETVFPAAVLCLMDGNEPAIEIAVGRPDPIDKKRNTTPATMFDLASLTKLFTTTAFLRLVANGSNGLGNPVCSVLPDFDGKRTIASYEDPLNPGEFVAISGNVTPVDAGSITFRQLLTHTSGLPAWRPIFRQPSDLRRSMVISTSFAYQPGEAVIYSDLGLILLGWSVETLTNQTLDQAIRALVTRPLGKTNIEFGPLSRAQTAPTEFCNWRKKRIHGEVHDENAWSLVGIAGHAGLFGTAAGVASLGKMWLEAVQGKSDGLLPGSLAQEAVSLQAESGDIRRGLGWALWSPDPQSMSHSLSRSSFGHTGFTGTSLTIDPDRNMVIACLTNEVYNGRKDRQIMAFRRRLHSKVAELYDAPREM